MVKYRRRAEKFTRNCIFKAKDECNIKGTWLTEPAHYPALDPAVNIGLIKDISGFSRGRLKQRRKLLRVQPR